MNDLLRLQHRLRTQWMRKPIARSALYGLDGDTPEYTWQHSRAQALDKAASPFTWDLPGAEYQAAQSTAERIAQSWWVVEDYKRHNQSLPPTAKTREEAIAYLEFQEGINRQAATMPGAQRDNDLGAADRSRRWADALTAKIAAEKQKAADDADAKAIATAKAAELAAQTAKLTNDATWLMQQGRALEYLAYPAAPEFFAKDSTSNPGTSKLPSDLTAAFAAHNTAVPRAAFVQDYTVGLQYVQFALAFYQRAVSLIVAKDLSKKSLSATASLRRVNDARVYLTTMKANLLNGPRVGAGADAGKRQGDLERSMAANQRAGGAKQEADAAKVSGDETAIKKAEEKLKAAEEDAKKMQDAAIASQNKSTQDLEQLRAQLAKEKLDAEAEQHRLIDAGRDAASKATADARTEAAKAIADAQAKAEADTAVMRAAQAKMEAEQTRMAAQLAQTRADFEGATQAERDKAAKAQALAADAEARATAAETKAKAAQDKLPAPSAAPSPPTAPTPSPAAVPTAGAIPVWAVAVGGIAVLGVVAVLLWPRGRAP